MSDYFRPIEKIKARKGHWCVACGHRVPPGEEYTQQTGVCDGEAFRNRYHHECWTELDDGLEHEFITGITDAPARLMAEAG